ncbi:MAG: hypothetical protein AAGD13_00190 [Pseudomonadota bacterium]
MTKDKTPETLDDADLDQAQGAGAMKISPATTDMKGLSAFDLDDDVVMINTHQAGRLATNRIYPDKTKS